MTSQVASALHRLRALTIQAEELQKKVDAQAGDPERVLADLRNVAVMIQGAAGDLVDAAYRIQPTSNE